MRRSLPPTSCSSSCGASPDATGPAGPAAPAAPATPAVPAVPAGGAHYPSQIQASVRTEATASRRSPRPNRRHSRGGRPPSRTTPARPETE